MPRAACGHEREPPSRFPPVGLTARTCPREISRVNSDGGREKFRAFLATKGLRLTNQRMAILEAALSTAEHFTAEQLLDRARSLDESVSRATVYRSLPILTECALLREVDIGKNNKFYVAQREGAHTQQAQVVCIDCERIFEISAPFMEWYGATVSSKLGLIPVSHRLQVHAHCRAWRETGACPHHA